MGLDPILATEYRRALLPIGASRFQRLLTRWRPTATDFGVLVSFLLVACGVKQRHAVYGASCETFKRVAGSATSLYNRISSRDNIGALALQSHDREDEADVSPEAFRQSGNDEELKGKAPRLVRTADMLRRHLDRLMLFFLGYKLLLLVLYTMPVNYGFGVKLKFLRWASRAAVFRMYLRVVPFISFGLVAAASLTSRFTTAPVSDSTVQRWRAMGLLNTVLSYCTLRLFELIRGDPAPLIQVEETAQDRDLLAVQPPPLGVLRAITSPQRKLFQPVVFLGLEELPVEKRSLLFVGNHNIWGLDTLLLMHGLYERTGIWLRPLGEHAWVAVPVVGEVFSFIGGVDGTRHNCDLLMSRGENMLVYPGGARESWKRTTDPRYAILWGDHHLGFAAMAVKHGYTIVPVASVGTEDVFTPAFDLPLDRILTLGGILPAPKAGTSKAFEQGAKLPVLNPVLSHAQRTYFRIMPPIPTAVHQGQEDDDELLKKLRDETKAYLQRGIQELLEYRKTDPERFVWPSKFAARL